MPSASIDYSSLVRRALVGVVANALRQAAAEGLPGGHHFYLTFRTDHDGVDLPEWLRATHPETLTVVLQHQFEGLQVDPGGTEGDLEGAFSVTLRFSGRPARLRVPFAALTSFADPFVGFGLTLREDGGAPVEGAIEPGSIEAPRAAAVGPEGSEAGSNPVADEGPTETGGNVIRFRPRGH